MAKLEAGSAASLADMQDLWAAIVVVPTTAEVAAAIKGLLATFEGTEKPRRSTDAQAFPYDDVHVIAQLGNKVSRAVAGDEVRHRRFEVQVHTGLEYAWWRATHDTLYKGGRRDWQTVRVASQARASLELLDAVLGDLHGAGQLQMDRPPEADPDNLEPAAWLELWRPSDRPHDILRFCETVVGLAGACGLRLADIEAYLHSDEARPLVGERDLTPTQVVVLAVAALVGASLPDRLRKAGRRVLITPEMERRRPELRSLDPAVRCSP
jgi:hypothetical protein